ncbi:MAG: twin-arginine translocation signal domain-containing protein [Candidatus Bathyarchaeota archaeon]|nr:twin-arginine translocation signal domain-containing protein [Candidatus Bathyarchaeota archaeon]
MPKLSRRKFLYAGAGAATAAGIGYLTKNYWSPLLEGTTPTSTLIPTASPKSENNPPYADVTLKKPRYIKPCVGQEVQFSNSSGDPDRDSLTYQWFVDERLRSDSKDLVTEFEQEGRHSISLIVSDGKLKDDTGFYIDVEPDQIYPPQPLYVKYKGASYYVGPAGSEWSNSVPSAEEMDEQLDTLHDDLGCNAVIVTGGGSFEDRMIECGEMAVRKGFDRVYIQPRYVDFTVDETIERISKFAPKVRSLREMYGDVVGFCFGHEFPFETSIVRGGSFLGRWRTGMTGVDWGKVKSVLPSMFRRIIDICKKNYGYQISYAAMPVECDENLVPWSDPIFESVGVDTYITETNEIDNGEKWWSNLFSRLRVYRKPIFSFDWGMMSYVGADRWGGLSPLYCREPPYDEEPQVAYTRKTLTMLHRERIDGCFWVMYNDNFDRGHGLYNPNTHRRKKGFYMYKSYQRVGT